MASFAVEVHKVKIEPHNGADALELAVIGSYKSVVKKDQFKDGDLVAYIPEASIVPNEILKEMGLDGRLHGPNKNRVKAIKLRGVVSQGLIYPAKPEWTEGQDVTESMNIVKYEPPIPVQFAGEIGSSDVNLQYDIENFKKYPDALINGEEVVMTEKIHGTFFCIGLSSDIEPENKDLLHGHFIVSSKGLIKKGIFLKDNERNANNTYIRTAKKFDLGNKLLDILFRLTDAGQIQGDLKGTIWLMGEVYGRSVQKNSGIEGYDIPEGELAFRAFDIKLGDKYLDYDLFKAMCNTVELETVPLIYRGEFSREKLLELTKGTETVSGKSLHIREGVVVKPVVEREDGKVGRLILKSVSDDYLMKTNGEEIS